METISYQQFLSDFSRAWEPGQHVALCGSTGSGKTFVAEDIKLIRNWLVVIASKSQDETLDGYQGFIRRSTWPPDYGERLVLYWKKPKNLLDLKRVQTGVYDILNHLYRYGGWTVYFDDLFFISETLKLKSPIKMFYTQVRSNDVSIAASIQRPFWVPVEALSQSTYVLLFLTEDKRDIQRVAEGTGRSFKDLLRCMKDVQQYEFLFIRRGAPVVRVMKKEKQ